ncbi:hypothetical protein [Paucidesulfovibrio longus]|uniref:hypothetical protein n=1 Tax=Paucidesulfovibrio longus TaxID=889 RepID=UPI0003B61B9A|nr:hypothetical protein [Paucidesulfovibrio longus]
MKTTNDDKTAPNREEGAAEAPIDVRHVVCNLTPTILGHLDIAKSKGSGEVIFLIRQGIQLEMRSAFSSVGVWEVEIATQIGHDVLRFTRRPPKKDLPDLNLLDY